MELHSKTKFTLNGAHRRSSSRFKGGPPPNSCDGSAIRTPDLRNYLDSWQYDSGNNVRLERGEDGRTIIVVRQLMGLEEYEVAGRPDGQRPHGVESALEFQLARLAAARELGTEDAFKLTPVDCAELFHESTIYQYRLIHLLHLKDWARAERDTARTLHLIDFVERYAEQEEDRIQFERCRADMARVSTLIRISMLRGKRQLDKVLEMARDGIESCDDTDEHSISLREFAGVLFQKLRGSIAAHHAQSSHGETMFIREGDFWTIRFQGQITRLKATRGLCCLSCLLRHPRREFHVSELIANFVEKPASAGVEFGGQRESSISVGTVDLAGHGPILDAQAKADYRRRLQDLREDLEEAERFGDAGRAVVAKREFDLISEQLASAVGLGGRDRRTGSDAERARSAVTKRIKESIRKITKAIPSLGRHLDDRIRTGYFCSYNPHPDHPIDWRF